MVKVERLTDAGEMHGGHVLTPQVAVACSFPAALVKVTFDDGSPAWVLDRFSASELADALIGCLCDG